MVSENFFPLLFPFLFSLSEIDHILLSIHNLKKDATGSNSQGLNFRAGWRDLRPNFRNPVEKNREDGRLPPWKILCFLEICFYETKLLVSEKFTDFIKKLDNFLMSEVISYCRSKAIVFRFYEELKAVRFTSSELNRGISCILPAFGEIIVYSCKMIVGLKNINCGKSS